MARFLFIIFVFANAFLNSVVVVVGAEFAAAPSPVSTGAEPPSGRKLGKHRSSAAVSSGSSPSEAPRSEMKVQATSAAADGGDHQHHNHKASDKSIAGGGVILGGLATTFLVAIICYIRATRRSNSEVN